MYPFSTRNWHACAISSGFPYLLISVFCIITSLIFGFAAADIGDSIIPGASAFTRIPFAARSRAKGNVRPATPPLLEP